MTTLKQLREEMREKAEKATPWTQDDTCLRFSPNSNGADEYQVGPHTFVCTTHINGMGEPCSEACATAEFIENANPANILALLKALDSAELALGKVHSAIGDRLLAHGPLSKEYAAIVLADIDAALMEIGGSGDHNQSTSQ